MAETTLLTQEDSEEIGSVLKLAPHARTSQFETVTKNTEDEPLVSLDELYEKTGQESINTFIKGFALLNEKHRLARAHGQALNIQGSESWSVIPDQLNVVRGSEGFFTAIKDGIVTIVKAIIAFISGVCGWIKERFARLFGFEHTVKEVKYLHDNATEINAKMALLVEDLGGRGKGFSPEEFMDTLPKGKTDQQQILLIKNRIDNVATTMKRLESALPAFEEANKCLAKIGDNANKANNNYRRAIDDLKRRFKNKDVSKADIVRFISAINVELEVTLNFEDMYKVMELLYKEFYGVELPGFGMDDSLSKARELLKNSTEIVKQKLNPEEVKLVATTARNLGAFIQTANKAGLTSENIKVGKNTMDKFSDMIGIKDAEFIQELSSYIKLSGPDGQDDVMQHLPAEYAKFCAKVRDYTVMVEILLKSVQEISKTYVNVSRWYTRLSTMVATQVTWDVKRMAEAMKANLSPEEQERQMPTGSPTVPYDLEDSFNKKYPGWNLPEDVSRILRDVQEVEQVNKPLQRFIATMKG